MRTRVLCATNASPATLFLFLQLRWQNNYPPTFTRATKTVSAACNRLLGTLSLSLAAYARVGTYANSRWVGPLEKRDESFTLVIYI